MEQAVMMSTEERLMWVAIAVVVARRLVWLVALVAVVMVVAGCSPTFRVTTVTAQGAVVCQSGSMYRSVRVSPYQVRSVHIGDVCPG